MLIKLGKSEIYRVFILFTEAERDKFFQNLMIRKSHYTHQLRTCNSTALICLDIKNLLTINELICNLNLNYSLANSIFYKTSQIINIKLFHNIRSVVFNRFKAHK